MARKPRAAHLIRAYAPADRAAVRDICCRTAFRNMGSDRFVEDRDLHADYWTRYYTDFRPEELRVVEIEGAVIGYFLGCSDHRHFERTMARHILPRLLGRALWRLGTGQYRQASTRAYLIHMLRHGASEAPRIPVRDYPAHYHCNILRVGAGRRLYSELTLAFLDRLRAQGITGLHGFITEPAEGGIWHRFERLYDKARPDHYDERPTGLFRAVLGDPRPMVNRGWAMPVAGYRVWIEWLRETRGL